MRKNLILFEAWDKKEKKFWGDFRIHPQGFVAPATSHKDGEWIYDWDYDQKNIVLIPSFNGLKKLLINFILNLI